jgi:hypothetical protein
MAELRILRPPWLVEASLIELPELPGTGQKIDAPW